MPITLSRARWLLALAVVASGFGVSVLWARLAPPPTHINGIYVTASEDEEVRLAYAIAMKRPGLLSQLPCHCGCMAKKPDTHGNVLDCFKSAHAETCPICTRTATYAQRAAAEGRPVAEMKRYLGNLFRFDF